LSSENTTAEHGQTRAEPIKVALSYALAIVCLVWVFHDYDFSDLLRRIATMNPLLVTFAIICDVLSFVCQGWRWRLLLKPFDSISVLRSTQAIYSGTFVNEVLPLKLGELLRAYLITRWTSVKLATVATCIVIERLFDGFWLVAAFLVTMIFIPLPRRFIEAGDVLSALILILIGLLAVVAWHASLPDAGVGPTAPVVRSLRPLLNRFAVELRVIVYSRSSFWAFALSLLVISLQWLAFWLAMLGFGLHLPLLTVVAVFVIVHVGTSLPGAPSNIGTFQFLTVFALTFFSVDKTSATGFSLIVFVLLSTHLCLLGFWAFGRSGLTLFGLRNRLSKSKW
jgi:uncharacterized membrane protein YbhN (UPF0104 family)